MEVRNSILADRVLTVSLTPRIFTWRRTKKQRWKAFAFLQKQDSKPACNIHSPTWDILTAAPPSFWWQHERGWHPLTGRVWLVPGAHTREDTNSFWEVTWIWPEHYPQRNKSYFFSLVTKIWYLRKRERDEKLTREINPSHTLLLQHWDTRILFFLKRDHFFIKVIYFLFVPGHRTSQGCLLFFTLTIQAIIQDGESAFSKAAPEVKKTPEKHWCHNLPSPSVRDWRAKIPQMSFQQALGWHCSPPKLTSVSWHLSPF